ncbi:MAG: hypothetical protein ACR2OZ_11455 [Verrucomicrobiales bacterium]
MQVLITMVQLGYEHHGVFAAPAWQGLFGRLDFGNGALLELRSVPSFPRVPALPDKEMANGYDDTEWAAFENRCSKASD